MKQLNRTRSGRPTRLQQALQSGIVEVIRNQAMGPGARLTEIALARQLRVSRTPVRAALGHLAARGIVKRRPQRGFMLAKQVDQIAPGAVDAPATESEQLFLAIARDRLAGALPDNMSEADAMRRYRVTRPVLLRVLGKLAEVGVVERKPGRGWLFHATIADAESRGESYRFRLLIEPQSLMADEFRLDPAWLADMRRRHHAVLATPWRAIYSVAFFEMNAAFHEGLAAASGNRFVLMAVQQQNRLRRFANYDWVFGPQRVVQSCAEHLEILDRLETGQRKAAASLLHEHLRRASALTRPVGGKR
jgi:DNA-binding GntR family transcriptional regulator